MCTQHNATHIRSLIHISAKPVVISSDIKACVLHSIQPCCTAMDPPQHTLLLHRNRVNEEKKKGKSEQFPFSLVNCASTTK